MTKKEKEEERLRDERIEAQDEKILKTVKELTGLIDNYEGWKAEPAQFACVELAICGGEGSREMYGILEEAKMEIREVFSENERVEAEKEAENVQLPEYTPPFISEKEN